MVSADRKVPRSPDRTVRRRVRVAHGQPPREGGLHLGPGLGREGERDFCGLGATVWALRESS